MKLLALITTAFAFSGCATLNFDIGTSFGKFTAGTDGQHITLGFSK